MYFNQVTLCGFVGNVQIFDQEVKKPCARLTLATHRRFKINGEVQEKTLWHTLCCFGKQVEIVKSKVSVGSQLLVVGELDYQDWTDEQGDKHTKTQINVRQFLIMDRAKAEGKGAVDVYQEWMNEQKPSQKPKSKINGGK